MSTQNSPPRRTIPLKSRFHFQGWTVRYSTPDEYDATKQTVVFVHGTPWSSDVFKPLALALRATGKFQTLVYDLPGYGTSQELDLDPAASSEARFHGDTSVAFQSRALTALLQHLGWAKGVKPAVIAHDIAGAIVLRAHLIHGCEFRSLLLMDTNAVLPWGDGFYKLVRSEPDTFMNLPRNIFEAVVRAVIRSACYRPTVLESGWEDILAQHWLTGDRRSKERVSAGQTNFVRQIAQANDADVAEMLDQNLYSKVECPVKILWGQNDTWIPEEKMRRFADLVKHCLEEFVVIEEAGHLLMLDQPERITGEVFDWLNRH